MIPTDVITEGVFDAARTVYVEARGERTYQSRLAVAWVIVNRFRSAKWFSGGTLTEVVKRKWQFSCWNAGDPNLAVIEAADMRDPMFAECVLAVVSALTTHEDDPTGGATHYHASHVSPPWANGHTCNCIIGHHVFYASVD